MRRALVALITATVLSGLAAAYASAYPRAEATAKPAPTTTIAARAR